MDMRSWIRAQSAWLRRVVLTSILISASLLGSSCSDSPGTKAATDETINSYFSALFAHDLVKANRFLCKISQLKPSNDLFVRIDRLRAAQIHSVKGSFRIASSQAGLASTVDGSRVTGRRLLVEAFGVDGGVVGEGYLSIVTRVEEGVEKFCVQSAETAEKELTSAIQRQGTPIGSTVRDTASPPAGWFEVDRATRQSPPSWSTAPSASGRIWQSPDDEIRVTILLTDRSDSAASDFDRAAARAVPGATEVFGWPDQAKSDAFVAIGAVHAPLLAQFDDEPPFQALVIARLPDDRIVVLTMGPSPTKVGLLRAFGTVAEAIGLGAGVPQLTK
jgi:hypothetical protein